MLRLAVHTNYVPVFSSPRFPPLLTWSRVFQSCVFQSRVFSRPAIGPASHQDILQRFSHEI